MHQRIVRRKNAEMKSQLHLKRNEDFEGTNATEGEEEEVGHNVSGIITRISLGLEDLEGFIQRNVQVFSFFVSPYPSTFRAVCAFCVRIVGPITFEGLR